MKKILIAGAAIILVFAGVASSAEMSGDQIANLRWNAANIDTLRALDKAAVARLVNSVADNVFVSTTENDIGEVAWVDLAGDGRYELATTEVTRCCVNLYIYWQEAPGKVSVQAYREAGDLDKTIRDLKGDGKQELILYAYVGEDQKRGGLRPSATWPKVYRLQNGSYVEASRDFPNFYDTEVLPQLEKDIGKARGLLAAQQAKPPPGDPYDAEWRATPRWLAALLMERGKILRMLGRDSAAGLAEAREWMKTPDPELVIDAAVVLNDMGGHEKELRAAKLAGKRAMERLPNKDW